MKMKKELSMLATVAAMASTGVAKGNNRLMEDVFNAPIDQILSVSDESIVTYRPEAHNVVEKDGKVTTNYYPTVAVSPDGSRGFAFQGPKPAGSALMVNQETGEFVIGSETPSGEFSVGQLNANADPLKGVKMETYRLQSNQFSEQLHKMSGTVGYMYDTDHVILFGKAGILGNNNEVTRAVRDTTTNGVFIVQQYTKTKAGTPIMGTHTSEEVFTSDGTQVSAYSRNAMDKTVTSVVEGTEIKGLSTVDDSLVYATNDGVHGRNGETLMSLTGITGMAKLGPTLYVSTSKAEPKAAPKSANGNIVPVYGAKQIITTKENGKDVLWKLNMKNQLQRVE